MKEVILALYNPHGSDVTLLSPPTLSPGQSLYNPHGSDVTTANQD